MKVLVLDASITLAWIFERKDKKEAKSAEKALLALDDMEAQVPVLWHNEILNALLIGERRKVITEATTIEYLNKLYNLPIHTDNSSFSHHRDSIMALAREYNLTAYDATYLDLALRLNGTLATFDEKLATAMQKVGGKLWHKLT